MPLVSVPAIYDGKHVRLLEEAPVEDTYRVLVTFAEPTSGKNRRAICPGSGTPSAPGKMTDPLRAPFGILTRRGCQEEKRQHYKLSARHRYARLLVAWSDHPARPH